MRVSELVVKKSGIRIRGRVFIITFCTDVLPERTCHGQAHREASDDGVLFLQQGPEILAQSSPWNRQPR